MEYDGLKYIKQDIVRAVMAIAEQSDCRLRNISLETLAELGNMASNLEDSWRQRCSNDVLLWL